MTRDPERERERISMIMAALFPHHSHMPPERNERKLGRKKGLHGETPGESRDEIKARTAAQKIEQQEQRAKAQQRALMHAAPLNVHHMSTRQKAQTKAEAPATPRAPSPSHSSSSESSSSSSTSSSPSKRRDDEQELREVPEEQQVAPEPPLQEQQPIKEPSAFLKLAKRLSGKTPATEALTSVPVPLSKEAQEALEMPPPDIPTPRQAEAPPIAQPTEHVSGASSYASVEEPDEGVPPSSKSRRSWASITSSAGSEDEMARGSLDDLQSHDPRPASIAMAGWGQGLGTATIASSLPDEERPVLTKPLILNPDERIMDAGRLIDSTLPIRYDVSETRQGQDFSRPKDQLPAWKNRQEFIQKLDGSRLLIVRAPTGSGKTTIVSSLSC